ncbi:MAG TPA: hypothetical protein P5513_06800 [Candidatus Diapherotrites archaeon]|nr:hypothetical protein [Candidatus Diapherotrites archaeon]
MIEKINSLKEKTQNKKIKDLCEKAIANLSEGAYRDIPFDAKIEIENAIIKNLFEELSAFKDNETKKWLSNSKRVWACKNLGVREAINSLSSSNSAINESLKKTLQFFKEKLQSEPEVLLYESFITAMQSFNYFPNVGNAIKDIKDRVDNYQIDVSITKIIETMKKTKSNYLVPLIEDFVQNYLDNKNEQTKSSLKEALMKFSYDPFIRDIINLVTVDATNLQLEYVNAQCDIEKVFSPVLYLGENEAVFSVRGSYYIKKGNTLSRLNKDSIKKLDPEFVALCEAINNPNVVIDGKTISVYGGKNDKAIISENGVLINGKEFTNEDYQNSVKVAKWTGKEEFLSLVEMLRSNFKEIAEIDFAKRVFLKEDRDHAADIFRLRDNISITTFNPKMGKGTFYRNINPIQAKKLMMEHLRFDMSSIFKDVLPDEEKINEGVKETIKEYESCISDLERRILEFQSKSFPSKTIPLVIETLKEELLEVKKEYKDYLNLVEKYTRIPKGDISEAKITLDIEGPLNIEVNGQKYTVPLPSKVKNDGEEEYEMEPEESDNQSDEERVKEEPASAITFDDEETELLGDSPSIQTDEVDLDADKTVADVDSAEAELAKEKKEKEEEKGEEKEETDKEGEIKIEDEDNLDLGLGEEGEEEEKREEDEEKEKKEKEEGEEEEEKKKKSKKEKIEDSTSNSKPKELKKKVFLRKRK